MQLTKKNLWVACDNCGRRVTEDQLTVAGLCPKCQRVMASPRKKDPQPQQPRG